MKKRHLVLISSRRKRWSRAGRGEERGEGAGGRETGGRAREGVTGRRGWRRREKERGKTGRSRERGGGVERNMHKGFERTV